MKKKLVAFLMCFVLAILTVSLIGCEVKVPGGEKVIWTVEEAFNAAKAEGYEGTIEDFLKSLSNIKALSINDKGELLVTLNNDTQINAGVVKGEKGKSAFEIAAAAGFKGTEAEWLLSLVGAIGETGVAGDKGDKGDKGVGVTTITVNENGEFVFTFSDNTSTVVSIPSLVKAQYTVTFDLDGGVADSATWTDTTVVKEGERVPLIIPLKTNCTFLGWFTTTNGVISVNDGQFTSVMPVTGDMTLKARWKAIKEYEEVTDTTAMQGEYECFDKNTRWVLSISNDGSCYIELPRESWRESTKVYVNEYGEYFVRVFNRYEKLIKTENGYDVMGIDYIVPAVSYEAVCIFKNIEGAVEVAHNYGILSSYRLIIDSLINNSFLPQGIPVFETMKVVRSSAPYTFYQDDTTIIDSTTTPTADMKLEANANRIVLVAQYVTEPNGTPTITDEQVTAIVNKTLFPLKDIIGKWVNTTDKKSIIEIYDHGFSFNGGFTIYAFTGVNGNVFSFFGITPGKDTWIDVTYTAEPTRKLSVVTKVNEGTAGDPEEYTPYVATMPTETDWDRFGIPPLTLLDGTKLETASVIESLAEQIAMGAPNGGIELEFSVSLDMDAQIAAILNHFQTSNPGEWCLAEFDGSGVSRYVDLAPGENIFELIMSNPQDPKQGGWVKIDSNGGFLPTYTNSTSKVTIMLDWDKNMNSIQLSLLRYDIKL